MNPTRALNTVLLALAVFASGCGGDGPLPLATIRVPVKLFVDDKPFGPASLSLSPTQSAAELPNTTGVAAGDGTVTLTTYGGEGVVPGEYAVTMSGDIMTAAAVPAVEPAVVAIKRDAASIEIRLKSIPGAAPVGGLPMPKIP